MTQDGTSVDYQRIEKALGFARDCGTIDGDHHKMWVIDQMVRALTGCPMVMRQSKYRNAGGENYAYETQGESDGYRAFVASLDDCWDEGIAP